MSVEASSTTVSVEASGTTVSVEATGTTVSVEASGTTVSVEVSGTTVSVEAERLESRHGGLRLSCTRRVIISPHAHKSTLSTTETVSECTCGHDVLDVDRVMPLEQD